MLRFVDSACDIREEFINTDKITCEVLASKIKEALSRWGLDFQNCRGQGYDVSVMTAIIEQDDTYGQMN